MPTHRFRAIALVAVSFAAALASSSCSEDPTEFEPIFSMTGNIGLAGTPQPGVRVEFFSNLHGTAVAFTGSTGAFIVSGAPNGDYQVTPVMAGQAFKPASRVTTLDNADVQFLHFLMQGGPTHSITGQTGDIADAKVTLTGDNTADVLSRAGGAFTIPAVRVGSYTITPTKPGTTFTPASVDINGVIDFAHTTSGTVGLVTVASVTTDAGANGASAFFDFPATANGGIGTIRPRRASELTPTLQIAYEALWQGAKVVTFVMSSGLGNQTIQFHLLPDHTYSATAANFTLTERLVNATGINFTATMP